MADNIKIIGNINDIQRIIRFNPGDTRLLNSEIKNETFGFENDYIKFFVYDTNGTFLYSDYNYRSFKLPSNSYLTPGVTLPVIEIDPVKDLENLGYISGEFFTQYNFQTRKISSFDNRDLFISQISDDRTEIRLKLVNISNEDLLDLGNQLVTELNTGNEQKYYIFNFLDNFQFTVINIAVDEDNPSILLKLYTPLPLEISEKAEGWLTEEIIEPYAFNLNLDTSVIPADAPKLRGPNFDIDVDIKQNLNTTYQNYSSIVSSLTGSSYQKILNYMNDNSYDLNIDYTSFENFIHFSSARTRIDNFYSKVKKIEDYNTTISNIVSSTNILKNEQTASIKLQIDDIIQNFDGFDSYMYFESSSYAWPKSNSNKPYTLLSTGSATVISWYNNYTGSADNYDENNLDYLYYALPNYVKNDPGNYQPYYTFIDMIGHYFDNVWIYITSINELYNADNNLEKGISKDLVYDQLKSLGVKLYNSKGDNTFDDYISGINSGSTIFVDDFTTGSAYLNNIPKKDLLAETYKRIYHNIPLLSKTRGTKTGLQNLINTFGVSGSTLQPKEFGGSTKQDLIKGYDNDKITIINNTITGSVLSSNVSLQTLSTASSDFTSTDLHFVDLSFSPQNQLNTRISASIASLNPTFSLDQYIGDPGLMASSSYDALIQQNNYFISASAAVSGSEKPLDYKGFIELVKYFDNSLFKMLKDFAPGRANTLTGITIKSPILERNKVPVYQPKVGEETVYDADYYGPTIEEDKSYYHDKLGGNKSSFYDGQITGSYVNVYSYFDDEHINPYLFPTESIDVNIFNHTDFNVMLNNVSSSVTSVVRKKIEPLYTSINNKVFTTGSNNFEYTSSAELQDSYLGLTSYNNSRYDGVKLKGLYYNKFTTSSVVESRSGSNIIQNVIYEGDISYGKEPVINHNTRKIGYYTQIVENPFLTATQKNNTALKYLVDESGSLTELNKNNKNWEEVQNIFKAGETLTISQFNSQEITNQKIVDGPKIIYTSGYSYFPMLYLTGSATNLYFEYSGDNVGKLFGAKCTTNAFISGSPNPAYQTFPSGTLGGHVVYNTFDTELYDPSNNYTPGNKTTPRYSQFVIPAAGTYTFSPKFNINVELGTDNQNITFTYKVIKDNTFTGTGGHPNDAGLINSVSKTLASDYTVQFEDYGSVFLTNFNNGTYTYTSYPSDVSVPGGSYNTVFVNQGSSNLIKLTKVSGNVYTNNGTNYYLQQFSYEVAGVITQTKFMFTTSPGSIQFDSYVLSADSLSDFTTGKTGLLSFDFTTKATDFAANDRIFFKLEITSSTANYTASIYEDSLLKNDLSTNTAGNYVYAVGSASNRLISSSISSTNNGNFDSVTLNGSLTQYLGYLFIPQPENVVTFTGQSQAITLANTYGSVNDVLSPIQGDVAFISWGASGYTTELVVKSVTYDNLGKAVITFTSNLPGDLVQTLNSNSATNTLPGGVSTFLLLRKTKDETNVILNFNRNPGNTSAGFIIPSNLHPDVLANIDTITKEVKQKLLQGTSFDAGGF